MCVDGSAGEHFGSHSTATFPNMFFLVGVCFHLRLCDSPLNHGGEKHTKKCHFNTTQYSIKTGNKIKYF